MFGLGGGERQTALPEGGQRGRESGERDLMTIAFRQLLIVTIGTVSESSTSVNESKIFKLVLIIAKETFLYDTV